MARLTVEQLQRQYGFTKLGARLYRLRFGLLEAYLILATALVWPLYVWQGGLRGLFLEVRSEWRLIRKMRRDGR